MKTDFEIDPKFLTSVTVTTQHSRFKDNTDLTEEEMIEVIKGNDIYRFTSSKDHPEFDKLRTHLSTNGFIRVQTGFWNGDTVLMPFTLNNKMFRAGDRFPCACAMTGFLKYIQK